PYPLSLHSFPTRRSSDLDCSIRSTDLRLLRRSTNAFRSLRLNEPRPGERFPVERRLYAGIAIRPGDLLDPAARQMLVHLYAAVRSEEHTSELQSLAYLVC